MPVPTQHKTYGKSGMVSDVERETEHETGAVAAACDPLYTSWEEFVA